MNAPRPTPLALVLALVALAGCETEREYVLMPEPPSTTPAIVLSQERVTLVAGGTNALGVKLAVEPTADLEVECTLEAAGGPFRVLDGARLAFTKKNWDAYQNVRIEADGGAAADARTRAVFRIRDAVMRRVDVRVVPRAEPRAAEESAPEGEDPAPPPPDPKEAPGQPERPRQPREPEVEVAPVPAKPDPTPGEVALAVRDASGAGAQDEPVTAVIPLPRGRFQDTDGFRMVGPDGEAVPAQFEVLNRWWARDRSVRHVMVHFAATVEAGGVASYRFQPEGGSNPGPSKPVSVREAGEAVVVDTGVLRLELRRQGFNLFDRVFLDLDGDGIFSPEERIVDADPKAGPVFTGRLEDDIQRASERDDIEIVVEESGPMRAMIRVRGLTRFESRDKHRHGFALRIIAYAGQSFVKVDYQLQNSAINQRFSAPLYFEDLSLHVKPELAQRRVRIATRPGRTWEGALERGRYLFQGSDSTAGIYSSDGTMLEDDRHEPTTSSMGWLDVSDELRGLCVTVRNMSETWPNGLEVTKEGDVAVRLWPKWSAQWHQGRISPTGLYWLEDMQQVVKETLFFFHGPEAGTADFDRRARLFQYHPICFVPVAEYERTRATLDFSGVVPVGALDAGGTDTGRITYSRGVLDPTSASYALGWANFYGQTDRKATAGGGGIPMTSNRVLVTGRVGDWLTAEAQAMGELNVRPQWLEGYTYKKDFETVRPHTAPYSGISWRALITGNEGSQPLAAPYLEGTGFGGWHARDTAHGWFYHVEQFYYFSGNPWIKDWYRFLGEFRKGERTLPGLASWSWEARDGWAQTRAEGHNLASLMSAYRIFGDPELLDAVRNRVRNFENKLDRRWGFLYDGKHNGDLPFMVGYFCRALSQVLDEIGRDDRNLHDRVLQLYWALVDWNLHRAKFCYFWQVEDTEAAKSGGTSSLLADPQAWFSRYTGWRPYGDAVNEYIDRGINGGRKPNGTFDRWSGQFTGRMTLWARAHPASPDAPGAIADLTARTEGKDVTLEWTTPTGAVGFHLVWSPLPFARGYTSSETERNMSAARVIPNSLSGAEGERQTLTCTHPAPGRTVHFALLCFDEDGRMSAASNLASVPAR